MRSQIESMRGSDAALIGLEEYTPEDFSSFSEAKDLIVMAGYTSESLFITSQNAIEKNAMRQEREAFSEYIKNLDSENVIKSQEKQIKNNETSLHALSENMKN